MCVTRPTPTRARQPRRLVDSPRLSPPNGAASAAPRRCGGSPATPATPTAPAARARRPLSGARRRRRPSSFCVDIEVGGRCPTWAPALQPSRRWVARSWPVPTRAASRSIAFDDNGARRPRVQARRQNGWGSCLRLDASVDAAVLAVVGGRLVNACVGGHGCAWAATGALATPSGFVYVSCVDIDHRHRHRRLLGRQAADQRAALPVRRGVCVHPRSNRAGSPRAV